jgi:PBSX family phage terminase large subunit
VKTLSNVHNVKVANEIAPYYHNYFTDWVTPHQVISGGRACTKTVCNAWKIASRLISDKACSVVVIRQTLNTHRDSTYAELIKVLDTIGVTYRAIKNPLEIQVGDNMVYFRCLDDYEKLKGMTSSKSPIKIAWFFEITEFEGSYEIQQVISTLARGGSKDYFIAMYEYNPPPHKTHWVYAWEELYGRNSGYRFQHNTYIDLPESYRKKWLGDFLLKEIELLKYADFETYKQIYMGLPAMVSGAIYKRFSFDDHVINFEDIRDTLVSRAISIGVDYGETDATTAVASHITVNREVVIFKEYYHKNGDSKCHGLKDINDYTRDLHNFIRTISNEYPDKYIFVYVDSASKSLYTLLNEGFSHDNNLIYINKINKSKKMPSLKGKTPIHERIFVTNIMLGCKTLFIDSECKFLISALERAEYHPETGERIDNGKFNIDSIDAMEYSFLEYLSEIYGYLVSRMGKEVSENGG